MAATRSVSFGHSWANWPKHSCSYPSASVLARADLADRERRIRALGPQVAVLFEAAARPVQPPGRPPSNRVVKGENGFGEEQAQRFIRTIGDELRILVKIPASPRL
jgi:hypothetical protein